MPFSSSVLLRISLLLIFSYFIHALVDNRDSHEKYTFNVDKNLLLRTKRNLNVINARNPPDTDSNNKQFNNTFVKFVHLNDSHEQLTVHWAGKNSPVVICLAKNRKNSLRNQSSAVYISHDYGSSFEQIKVFKLKKGGEAVINTFYISPVLNSYYLFVDNIHNCIFITKDFGTNFQRIDLSFTPKTFKLHHSIPNLLLSNSVEKSSSDSSLYLSENFGLSWKKIEEKINYFSWSVEGVDQGIDLKTIFIQRNEPSGLSTILSSNTFFQDKKSFKIWLTDVEKVDVNEKFIFATRRLKLLGMQSHSSSYQLWISVDRKPFYRTMIPLHQQPINYHIADITANTIFLCVTYNDSSTYLYTSDANFESFSLSMENIVFYNSKFSKNLGFNNNLSSDREFADLTRVSGIRGTYIVSKWKNTTRKSSEMITLMTFDMGNKWHKLKPPSVDAFGHQVLCNLSQNCSLHLVQRYLSLNSNTKSVLTKESSVGFIMATGVIGTSLKGKQNIYLSIDAGNTWRQILSGNYLFAFGDFGAIIVAVAHYSRGNATNELLYSIDDGESFSLLQFSNEKINVYGLLTEPGEKTAIFTIFGSKESTHEWIVIQINCTSLFKFQCKAPYHYKEWSPHDFESDCLLGSTQIFQRRVASHRCYNGESFVRPTAKINCPCKPSDYECDIGYVRESLNGSTKCILSKDPANFFQDPLFVPNECRPGKMFNKSKGFRKINGNTCEGGEEDWYSPQVLPCPFNSSDNEFILFVQKHQISMISLNTKQFSSDILIPKYFVTNAIAADFDIEKNCLFWSDMSYNRILKYCLNGRQFQPEVLVENDLVSVEGIAFNQINHHLYFVNGNLSKIEMINVDINYEGRMRKTIVKKPNIEKPRGIALDPISGYLFFTDWSSTSPGVLRSELDGENLKVLFNSNTVTWPNGIAIDHRAQKIFWVDAMHDYIASSDYDGKLFKFIIQSDQTSHPFAIGVFKNFLFFDDLNLHELILINKNDGSSRKVLLNNLKNERDLKIITPFFHNQTNICNQNKTCEHLCVVKPFNSYRCVCPDGFIVTYTPDGNEKCSCPPNQELTKTGACRSLFANATCFPNDFICDNGNCISRFWKCDEDDDCGDKSDEKFCSDFQCKPNEFQCKNTGQCIVDIWKCDFEKECEDGSDEDITMCSSLYPNCTQEGMFQCKNLRCIDKSNVCDHIDHCRDGSDEINCSYHSTTENTTCDDGYFKCDNGDCIQKLWRCDGHNDCLDKSDEKDCESYQCMSNEFFCPNFICIDKQWVCDSEKDCIDGSDEIDCIPEIDKVTTVEPPKFTGPCSSNFFSCKSGKCIPMSWHCDGNNDCQDGSDEYECGEIASPTNNTSLEENGCGPNKFFCYKSNLCIFGSYVCDGDFDCFEGEDEIRCKYNYQFKCPDLYACLFSIGCIEKKRVCDGHKDCFDGSDEWGCENSKKPVNLICFGFTCKYGECIERHLRCDGQINCFDKSDEEGCEEEVYDVKNLHVYYNTIKSDSFTVSWQSPNSTLKFLYMPSYSLFEDEKVSYNSSWTSFENHTFHNLNPGFTYKVIIYCKPLLNESIEKIHTPRNFIMVTTESIAPNPPLNFSASNLGFNRVEVKWTSPQLNGESIKGYKVYVSPPDPPKTRTFDYQENVVQLCCFQIGTNYTFWVTTLTKNLESVDSEKVPVVIGAATTIKVLHQKNVTNSSVLLEWKAFPNRISKWLINYQCEDYMPSFSKNYTIEGNIALITDLSPGVDYQFKLYPYVNDSVWFDGVQDNVISIQTLGPQLPSLMVDSKVQGSVVSLSWTPPTQYKNYTNIDWEYGIYVGYNTRDIKIYARTRDTHIVLKNLFSCEIYMVQIRVIEPFGIGPASNDYKIVTKFDPTSPPKDLKFESSNVYKTKYRISWKLPCLESNDKPVGYIVTVNDIINGSIDRFRFQPSNDFFHYFDLSVHYGATYEIKVSTDHPDARWSDSVILKAPSMPKVLKPIAYTNKKGEIVVVWKTIDNYPKDYQEHLLQYKIFISQDKNVLKGEHLLVKDPPAIHEPASKSSVYYIAVSLVDNHGYEGPLSEIYHLYTKEIAYQVQSSFFINTIIISLIFIFMISSFFISHFVFKKIFFRKSPVIVSSHYNSRSDSATLSSYDNIADDDANIYSDDEPLVLA